MDIINHAVQRDKKRDSTLRWMKGNAMHEGRNRMIPLDAPCGILEQGSRREKSCGVKTDGRKAM